MAVNFLLRPNDVIKRILVGFGSGKLIERCSSTIPTSLSNLSRKDDPDMPDPTLDNPYVKEKPLCILCKTKVQLDYKNPQLLSQFVSRFTGRVYGKHVTGLCSEQQTRVEKAVKRSRSAGYMPHMYKDLKYVEDPKLFDISNVGKKF